MPPLDCDQLAEMVTTSEYGIEIAAPMLNAGIVNSEALPAVPNGHTFNVPATLGASRAMYAVPAVPSCATPSHDTSQVVNDGINCFDVSLPAVESMAAWVRS